MIMRGQKQKEPKKKKLAEIRDGDLPFRRKTEKNEKSPQIHIRLPPAFSCTAMSLVDYPLHLLGLAGGTLTTTVSS